MTDPIHLTDPVTGARPRAPEPSTTSGAHATSTMTGDRINSSKSAAPEENWDLRQAVMKLQADTDAALKNQAHLDSRQNKRRQHSLHMANGTVGVGLVAIGGGIYGVSNYERLKHERNQQRAEMASERKQDAAMLKGLDIARMTHEGDPATERTIGDESTLIRHDEARISRLETRQGKVNNNSEQIAALALLVGTGTAGVAIYNGMYYWKKREKGLKERDMSVTSSPEPANPSETHAERIKQVPRAPVLPGRG